MGKVPDVHTARAAVLFNIDPSKVTPAQRQHAKMRNYFDAYGQVGKLEEYKNVSRTNADRQSLQEAFRNNLGRCKDWQDNVGNVLAGTKTSDQL